VWDRGLRGCRGLFHDQYFVPQHAGFARFAACGRLDDLLARVLAARDKASEVFARRPVLLKIAPDLTLAELDEIVKCARSKQIDGLIVSNTTIARPASLRDPAAAEQGGLSGARFSCRRPGCWRKPICAWTTNFH